MFVWSLGFALMLAFVLAPISFMGKSELNISLNYKRLTSESAFRIRNDCLCFLVLLFSVLLGLFLTVHFPEKKLRSNNAEVNNICLSLH